MPKALILEETGGPQAIYQPTGEEAFQAYWRTLLADCKIYPTQRLDPSDLAATKKDLDSWRQAKDGERGDWYPLLPFQTKSMLRKMDNHWRFTETESGFYCMVPRASNVGDTVAVLRRSKVQRVLRPSDSRNGPDGQHGSDGYRVIGPAYVHGLIDGQAIDLTDIGVLEAETFTLV